MGQDKDIPHQRWLEHCTRTAIEPAKEAFRKGGKAFGLDVFAAYVAGYALGKLLAMQDEVLTRAPDAMHQPWHKGIEHGRAAYKPLTV